MRYLIFIIALFAALQTNAQNNIVYGAGINYTNGAPTFTPPVRTSRVVIDTVTGKWYHFNTPGGWQLIGNTIEEIAGCTAPAYTPGKGDSKVVINNCSPQPELYFYNGSAWVLVGGGSFYAGEGIRIENDTIILDSLYVLRFRTGSNTDGAAGAMSWNATEETLDLVTDQGAVTGHLLESAYYNARNTTGTPITIGTVVMANGTTGNTGRILIAPAIADGSVNSEYILGITAQTIGNNANGKVQHFGKIRGIQTNGANYGESWADGNVLYCSASTPGYLTKVLPTAPNLKVPIAIVIHAHPSNGTLFVRPSHFPDLAQINDVQLSSPTNGQVLTYNSTLSRWENATPADTSATNELQTLSLSGSDLSISGGNTVTLPATGLTGNGVSPFVAQYNSTNTLDTTGIVWNGGRMGVGLTTTTVTSRLQIRGQGNTSSTEALRVNNSNNQIAFRIMDNGIFRFGNAGTDVYIFPYSTNYQSPDINGSNISFYPTQGEIAFGGGTRAPTSGSIKNIIFGGRFQPTSGTATCSDFEINSLINQTGGANGITRGLYVNATLQSAANWRSIEYSNNTGWGIFGAGTAKSYFAGNVAIGTTTQNAAAAFEVASTTQGVLFPRMTTTQRNAIATPADGLVIYNTTDNKLQVRAGGAWVDLH